MHTVQRQQDEGDLTGSDAASTGNTLRPNLSRLKTRAVQTRRYSSAQSSRGRQEAAHLRLLSEPKLSAQNEHDPKVRFSQSIDRECVLCGRIAPQDV